MKRSLAAFALLLMCALVTADDTYLDPEQRYLAEIELHTADEMQAILQRTEALLLEGVIPLDGEPRVAFVLHGPEVDILLRQNYLANKPVVDLAASLSALGVVEIKACEAWMGSKGINAGQLQPFVETVPYGPAEERDLMEQQNYVRF
jgi:uncharacterized protein